MNSEMHRCLWLVVLLVSSFSLGCGGTNISTRTNLPTTSGRDSANANTPDGPGPIGNETSFQLMKPFFAEFCISCHSGSSPTGSLETYNATRRLPGAQWWTLVVSKVVSGAMPPSKPRDAEAEARFAKGLELLLAWKAEGFPELSAVKKVDVEFSQSLLASEISSVDSCQGDEPLPARLWLLTKKQIQNIITQVFGAAITIADFTHPSLRVSGLSVPATTFNDEISLNSYVSFVESISLQVIRTNQDFGHCYGTTGTYCVSSLVTKYGRLLWRRPLVQAEIKQIVDQFIVAEPLLGRLNAVQMVLERLLVSPHFMYRSELTQANTGSGSNSLTPYEIASLLSFTIWNSSPDEILFTAAERGELNSPTEIEAQITRMMEDQRSKNSIREMLADWLQLDRVLTQAKDQALYPNLDYSVRQSLRTELDLIIDELIWKDSATVAQLFRSSKAFVSKATTSYYGVNIDSATPVLTSLDSTKRAGLLTHPGFILGHSGRVGTGFVHRGVFFLDNVSCKPIPQPPPGVAAMANMMLGAGGQRTGRQLQADHSRDPSCAACHRFIDPVGAAFESYDSVGKFRLTENGLKIDPSGQIDGLGDVQPKFNNAVSLVGNLADSQQFQQCFTKRLYQYSFGGVPLRPQGCELARVHSYLKSKSFTVKEVYRAIFKAKNILIRSRSE